MDLQESGAFLEKFSKSITSELLRAPGDLEAAARPLQATNAEQKYAYLTTDVNNFLESWNDNPANRSKVGTLFKELEQTKDDMVQGLNQSMERGQKVEESLDKSQQLVNTSTEYKRTAKKVERNFCLRKWKLIGIGILITILFALFLWLIF